HALEEGLFLEFVGRNRKGLGPDVLPRIGPDELAVGQRSGRARHHALAARDARRIAHRVAEVERNASGVALARAADDLVVANLVAGTHAAIAENAGVVIDGDDQRRLVLAAVRGRRRMARRARVHTEVFGDGAQLIVTVLPVLVAARVVVG